jgi:uncharacterized protein HemX
MKKPAKRKSKGTSRTETPQDIQDQARRELRRRLRAAQDITRLSRQLERAITTADAALTVLAFNIQVRAKKLAELDAEQEPISVDGRT